MNTKQRQAAAVMALLCTVGLQAQVVNNGGLGDYRLTLNGNAPRSFTIGSAFYAGASAFNIRGDQMGGTSVTPEVFRTIAPTTGLTYWRMFQGGTTAGFERGQLFADTANSHFNINAPNGHFQLHTQNVQRARLNGNVTGPIGPTQALEFPNINRDGFFLLSGTADAFTNAASRAPFTRLHLIDNAVSPGNDVTYAQQHGYRPWQRNGITFTGNSDQSYIGQKHDGNDTTDFVIQWSDNPSGSSWGVDRMKFVFTTQFSNAANRGAASTDGLEAIRLWPRNNFEVNVGIGDYFGGNVLTPLVVNDPTERLDILTGRLRIRDLPSNAAATDSFLVMVVDRTTLTQTNQERGVVKWVHPSVLTGSPDCDWEVDTTNNRLTTAWRPIGTNGACPDASWLTGIGNPSPRYKLEVIHTENDRVVDGGLKVDLVCNDDPSTYGIYSRVKPAGPLSDRGAAGYMEYSNPRLEGWGAHGALIVDNGNVNAFGVHGLQGNTLIGAGSVSGSYGVRGISRVSGGDVTKGFGVLGESYGASGSLLLSYGVFGVATGGDSANYGLWGEAGGPNNWAAYVNGRGLIVNGPWQPSDQQLKIEVPETEGTDGAEVQDPLMALPLHRYQYNLGAFPSMDLPEGTHLGFYAQELEALVPEAVTDAKHPAVLDSVGNEVHAAVDFKAINSTALIPYLVQTVQRQQARLDELAAQLNACCTSADNAVDPKDLVAEDPNGERNTDRLLTIAPNPFTDHTTVSYTLERGGRAMLLVNSSDGKQLQVLHEAVLEQGEYRYEWRTGHLAPGMYYVTLLLDGEPLVKRAVKVQ